MLVPPWISMTAVSAHANTQTHTRKKNTKQDPTPSNGSCHFSSLHLQASCPALPECQLMCRYTWLWHCGGSCGLSVPHWREKHREGKRKKIIKPGSPRSYNGRRCVCSADWNMSATCLPPDCQAGNSFKMRGPQDCTTSRPTGEGMFSWFRFG